MKFIRPILIRAKALLMPLRIRCGILGIKRPMIVEIGANDGMEGESSIELIRRTKARSILVEPVPHLFKRLSAACRDLPDCILENVAIGSTRSKVSIYSIDPAARQSMPQLPDYFEGLASFSRERPASVLGDRAGEFLREDAVEVMPLGDLFEKHRIDHVDLIQIDTEGHDLVVLRTFPFDRMRPALVCFEHSNLSEADRKIAVEFMRSNGYRVERWGKDFICARRGRARA